MTSVLLFVYTSLSAHLSDLSLVSGQSCSWTIDDFTLDLSSLAGTTLSKSVSDGDDDFEYTYSPCQNGVECETKDGKLMAIQQGNNCNELAYWNSSTAPVYTNGNYQFTFSPVATRIFIASFACGSGQATVDSVYETSNGNFNVFTMTIASSLACNGENGQTTTSAPKQNCSWTTTNNYQLDLSSLYGNIITYNTDTGNNASYEYFYTPCANGLNCIQGDGLDSVHADNSKSSEIVNNAEVPEYDVTKAMVMQADVAGACSAYLALFDPEVEPSYYPSSQSFVFNYFNGEGSDVDRSDILVNMQKKPLDGMDNQKKSKGLNTYGGSCATPRQTIIEWACNKTVPNGQYQVQYVNEVSPCIYNIAIVSPLACATNTTFAG